MARPLNRMWRLTLRPDGEPSDEDVSWHEEPAAELGDGDVLVQLAYTVVDPLLWAARPLVPDEPMVGAALGTVIESRDPAVPIGSKVSGLLGWQIYARTPGSQLFVHDPARRDEDYLGALNYIGATAYLAVKEIAKAGHGDTVVVTAGASAVGSLAGQIAKLEGARVVGIAAGAEQCALLTGELGFDAAIDRRADDVGPALARTCPDGIDIVVDGLGGPVLDACLARLALHARLALFGTASLPRPIPGPVHFPAIASRRALVRGFSFVDYPLQLGEALEAIGGWLTAGKLHYRLDISDGLEHAATAMRRVKAEGETVVLRISA